MDKDHIIGAADKGVGAAKEAVGKLTGDDELRAEGAIDAAKGAAHSAIGDLKDAVRSGLDAITARRPKDGA